MINTVISGVEYVIALLYRFNNFLGTLPKPKTKVIDKHRAKELISVVNSLNDLRDWKRFKKDEVAEVINTCNETLMDIAEYLDDQTK